VQPDELHVVIVTRSIAPWHGIGGLEQHGHDLIRHLLREGVCVTLITRPAEGQGRGPADDRLRVVHVPYVTFPLAGRRGTTVVDRSTAYPLFGMRAGRLAAKIVRAGGVHLVHGMGAAVLGYARARLADHLGTVPLVFNPHGMEEFGSTGHGLPAVKQLAYAPLRRAVKACARAADRVIATDHVLAPAVARHLDVTNDVIRVVPNAVDLDALDRLADQAHALTVRRRLQLTDDDALLLAVGRLEQNKGFEDLIAALARIRQPPACAIVGEGPHRGQLAAAIASAGLGGSVHLVGRVETGELHGWYKASTLFVHPTRYEGSSLVTLEAMAHGKPVVGTRAGGLPDKIAPGTNGWLVNPGDVTALAHAIEEALLDRARLAVMGRSSRAKVEEEFSWTVATRRLLAVYDEALRGQ